MSARAIRTRPTPGDFVRELGVDNKTTIPAPWFRRDGAARRGEDQIRNDREQATGGAGQGALRRSAPPAATGNAGRNEDRRVTWQSRSPWFAPSRDGAARDESRPRGGQDDAQRGNFRRAPDGGDGSTRPSSGSVMRSREREAAPAPPARVETERRQRDTSQEPQPRVWSGGGEAYRSRSDGGAAVSRQRDASGGGGSRPSGGEVRSMGGGNARPSGGEVQSSGGRAARPSAAETRPPENRSQGGEKAQRRGRQ